MNVEYAGAKDYLQIQRAVFHETMTPEMACAVRLAIKALDKQIPRKPVVEKGKVMFGIICGNCPVCDSAVYSTKNLFCNRCGQALEW